MLSDKDIYAHLANGGKASDLYSALEKEIAAAQKKIKDAKAAELKKKEDAEKAAVARAYAINGLEKYFSIVNPHINTKIINATIDALESIEIISNTKENCKKKDKVMTDILDEELNELINILFGPFVHKKK